jgi:hypothetical protein
MTVHVIGDEIIVLDQKAEIGVLFRKLNRFGDNPVPARQALFARSGLKEIQVREWRQIHLPRLGFHGRLRCQVACDQHRCP